MESTSQVSNLLIASFLQPPGLQDIEVVTTAPVEPKGHTPGIKKRRPKATALKDDTWLLMDGYIEDLRRNSTTTKEIARKVKSKFDIKLT